MSDETTDTTDTTDTTAAEGSETTSTTDATQDAGTQKQEAKGLGDAIADAGEGKPEGKSEKSAETKGSGETTASEDGEGGDSDDGQPDKGAPETYSGFDVPEGFAWSEKDTEPFAEQMKGLDASQEQAQEMLSFMAAHVNDRVIPGLEKRQEEEYAEQVKQLRQAAQDDPVLGGENGELFDSNLKLSAKVLDRVTQDLKKAGAESNVIDALQELGDLHRPALMHVLVWAGKRTLPDTLDGPGDGGGVSDDWDSTPAHERMGWDDDANPIRNRQSA